MKPNTKEASSTPGGSTSQTNVREPGWRSLPSTAAFRAVNPELFIKPNKLVMTAGMAAFIVCAAYIGYINLKTDRTKQTYMAINEKDQLERHYKTSKWD